VEQTPQGFASEDEEATYCLSLLRDGDRHQKIVARERLSQLFEKRGMLDEAAQCLESNIREGVRDPRVYQRLAGVYRRQGRHELADEVLVEARRLAERMTRPPAPGARRPGPGPVRPGRPPQPTPPPTPPPGAVAPGALQAPTAQLPATQAAGPALAPVRQPMPAPPGSGELELDRVGVGPRPGSGLEPGAEGDAPPSARPWWASPAMIVLMVLLCGPYGLAVLWVNGGYAKKTRQIVTGVWAVFAVLACAGAAMTMQSQIIGLAMSSAGLGSLPGTGATAPTIVYGPTPGVGTRPTIPGIVPAPPSIGPSPGLPPGGGGTIIEAAPTAAPKPDGSPTVVAQNPDADSNAQKVKVKESDGTSVNLRDKPGTTGAIVKSIPEGTVLDVIGEDRQMDGQAWKNVKDESGATGWMAASLLEPA
jgi:hypothetical protein